MRRLSVLLVSLLMIWTLSASEADFTSPVIHVGVVVSDLDKSLAFYKDVVGMVSGGSFDVNEDMSKRTGLAAGVPFHVEILKLSSDKDMTQFKLMTFGERTQKQQNQYIYDHTGMRYVTIFVNELEPIIKRIKAHNVKMLGDSPTELGPNNFFVLVQDPDGIFVELIGPMKK
jgi:catechol 2,3-dioxygenase-like lactoylglutathione lyase family enzyme